MLTTASVQQTLRRGGGSWLRLGAGPWSQNLHALCDQLEVSCVEQGRLLGATHLPPLCLCLSSSLTYPWGPVIACRESRS